MHSTCRSLILSLLSLLAVSIAPTTLANDAADRAALEAAAQAWIKAFNARDTDALQALATDDVVLLDPNLAPVNGRKAVRAAWQRAFNVAGQVSTATKEIVIVDTLAWRLSALARKQPNAEVIRSHSLEIWKRVGSNWKLHRQMAANILSPPQLPYPPISQPVLDIPGNQPPQPTD
jgi:ketosteroid isomerase-like protein